MKKRIGNFEHIIDIIGIRFLVRGLTVGEYIDLVEQDYTFKPDNFYKTIALECIVDWDNLFYFTEYETDDEGEIISITPEYDEEEQVIYIDYNEDTLNDLHDLLLIKLGRDIYHKYSVVSKEDFDKFQAFARWMYYASGDDSRTKSDVKTFECKECISGGLRSGRKCGLSEQMLNSIINSIDDENVKIEEDEENKGITEEERLYLLKYKPSPAMFRKAYDTKDESEDEEESEGILRDYFNYKECPTSMIDSKIRVVAEKIYFAHKSNIPFFGGGMIDQDNRFVSICQIINSECNKIESERHKRDQEEAQRKR